MQGTTQPAMDSGSIRTDARGVGRRYGLKAAIVALLTLLLLIPLGMINGTISERKHFRLQAVTAVAESFAGAQSLAGPVLIVPYTDHVQVQDKDAFGKPIVRTETYARRWIFFPKAMTVRGTLLPSVRKRGLHEVRVYELQSVIDARFDTALPDGAGADRQIGQPYLSISLSDVRGLVGTPQLSSGSAPLVLEQGVGGHREGSGLHARLAPMAAGERIRFATQLRSTIAGTELLSIAPIADDNVVRLQSTWPHPQFSGRFLPRTRRIAADGFDAQWEISSLASGTQAQYRSGSPERLDAIGLGLVDPVNLYSQADRATKYGILFVLLTFVAFFLFELLKRLAIHPIQYALVGLALALFFLLLLSLSEHLQFWLAYLIASAACIGLLAIYLSAVLGSTRRGLGFATGLTLLYAALYGLLVSEDNALVLGSLMLFVILAGLMLITRGIDWYAAGSPRLDAADE